MARTALSVEELPWPPSGGLQATYTAVPGTGAGEGFEIASDPSQRTFVDVDAAGGAVVVTITTPGSSDGIVIAERTVTVGAGTHEFIALRRMNKEDSDLTGGTFVYFVDFDVSASVTVAALKVTAE